MTDVTLPSLKSATAVCLVANTPTYLFKRLREDDDVQCIGRRFETSEIIELLTQSANDVTQDPNTVVKVYVFLVAMSFNDYPEFSGFLATFDAPQVRWIDELKSLIVAKATSTTTDIITGPSLDKRTATSPTRFDSSPNFTSHTTVTDTDLVVP